MDELGSLLKSVITGFAVVIFVTFMGITSLWRNLWEQDIPASQVEVTQVRWHGSIPTIAVAAVIRNNSEKAISDFDVVVEGYDCPLGQKPHRRGWDACYFLASDENTLGASIPAGRLYRYEASFTLRPNSAIEGKLVLDVKFANFEGN